MGRYSGKPFLRLLECFILDAIDKLDDRQCNELAKMEPKLADIFGQEGAWRDVVKSQMDFPEDLPENIRKFWQQYSEQAEKLGQPADPEEFARSFVDQNFPHE